MVLKYYHLYMIRQSRFLKSFFKKTLILMTQREGSVPALSSKTKLKLHNIFINRNVVSKFITTFWFLFCILRGVKMNEVIDNLVKCSFFFSLWLHIVTDRLAWTFNLLCAFGILKTGSGMLVVFTKSCRRSEQSLKSYRRSGLLYVVLDGKSW